MLEGLGLIAISGSQTFLKVYLMVAPSVNRPQHRDYYTLIEKRAGSLKSPDRTSTYLPTNRLVCLFAYLSVCLSTYLYLPTYLSKCLRMYVTTYIHTYVTTYLFANLFVCLSLGHLPTYQPTNPRTYVGTYLPVCLST